MRRVFSVSAIESGDLNSLSSMINYKILDSLLAIYPVNGGAIKVYPILFYFFSFYQLEFGSNVNQYSYKCT